MNYFIADPHYNHTAVIEYEKRPFANANNMNMALDSNWNKVVRDTDDVWVGGDWSFYWHSDVIQKKLSLLNGRKHLILGNHDYRHRVETWIKIGFQSVHTACPLYDKYLDRVWIIHDPKKIEELGIQAKVVLHGHSHLKSPKVKVDNGVVFVNIGVDLWDFKPISSPRIVNEVKKYLEKR